MSIPAISIIFGIEPRLAMPMLGPGGPVDRHAAQSAVAAQARDALAKQVVGGRVVGLPGVSEASGDRAEHDRGADLAFAERVQQVEPAVDLDVEDEVVLALGLVGEEVAYLESRRSASARRRGRSSRASADDCSDTRSGSVRSTWCQCARAARSRIASIASSAARARSIRESSRSTSFGVGRSPRCLIRSASSRFSPSRSEAKRARSGSAGSGSGTRSSRWNVPPEARCQVGRDGRDDAARCPGDAEDGVGSRELGPGRARPTARGARRDQRRSSAWPTSTAPGSRSVSSIRISASAAVLRLGAKSTDLDERVGTLASQRLDEAGHRAAHDRRRAAGVVAVAAAEAGGGDQEGALRPRSGRRGRASSRRAASPGCAVPSPRPRDRARPAAPPRRGPAASRRPGSARPPSSPRSDARAVLVLGRRRSQHLDAELRSLAASAVATPPRPASRSPGSRRRARPRSATQCSSGGRTTGTGTRRGNPPGSPLAEWRRPPACSASAAGSGSPARALRPRSRTNPTTWFRVG